MDTHGPDTVFAGSVPELYDSHFVPLIFEPYAEDMARRVAALAPSRVLETAAGTGVVTRAMARSLAAHVDIVATDLNQPMLDRAAAVGTQRPVRWQQADAMKLPFEAGRFDVLVCQFGVMFFPDKAHAFAEARRVLRRGGMLLFNVWDRIEHSEFAHVAAAALARLYPTDPPRFMERTPHGYSDQRTIARDLANGGFTATPRFETVTLQPSSVGTRGRHRLLPGNTLARGDRGACRSRRGPRAGDVHGRGRDRRSLRHGPDRRKDPGARRQRPELTLPPPWRAGGLTNAAASPTAGAQALAGHPHR
jgi:SAM-dependent methyltransferase